MEDNPLVDLWLIMFWNEWSQPETDHAISEIEPGHFTTKNGKSVTGDKILNKVFVKRVRKSDAFR